MNRRNGFGRRDDQGTVPDWYMDKEFKMKRFAFACVLCGGLLIVVGCKETTSQPAAQSPPTDVADQQQVMKPALPAEVKPETEPVATSEEEPEPANP